MKSPASQTSPQRSESSSKSSSLSPSQQVRATSTDPADGFLEQLLGQGRTLAGFPSPDVRASAAISEGFSVLNREWRLVYVSDSVARMAGIEKAALLGRNIWEWLPGLKGTRLFVELHRALEQQTPTHFEFFHTPSNRWFEHRAYPCEEGIAVFSADVTERKRQDELLRLQASALSQLSHVVFTFDHQRRVTYWNKRAEVLYGYSRDEVIGRRLLEVIRCRWLYPEDEAAYDQALATVGFWQGEVVHFRKSGEEVYVDSSVGVVSKGGEGNESYLALVRDITQRKRSEKAQRTAHDELETRVSERTSALTEANEVLRRQAQLLDLAHDAIIVRRADSSITYWNRGAEETYGWTREEAQGKITHVLLRTEFPEPRSDIQGKLFRNDSWRGELVHTRRDGARIAVASTQVVQRDEHGQPSAILEINRDVTLRKQAEEALRESGARLLSIMQSSPSIAFIKDRQGRYRYVSPQFEQLCDLPLDQVVGKRDCDIFPPAQADAFRANDLEVLLKETPLQFEEVALHKDGLHTSIVSKFPLRDGQGAVYGVCGMATDITERKRAEHALQESEARLRALIESMDDIAFEIDESGVCVNLWTTNRALLPRPKEEMIGQAVGSAFGEEFARPFLEAFKRVSATGCAEGIEYSMDLAEGKRWFLGRISPIRSKGSARKTVCLLVREITDRKKAEETLKESEERVRLVVEGARDYAMFMLDPVGRVLSWNIGAERIKGYRAGEIVGKHFSVFYPAEDVQAGKPNRLLEIAVAQGSCEDEGWRVRKDSSRFWASVVITALRDKRGSLRGFSKVTRNMTRQKQAEDSVRELSGRLLQLQDEERQRLAKELHDSAVQTLAALTLNLGVVKQNAHFDDNPAASRSLDESLDLARKASRETRTLSYLLHPPMLDESGLLQALGCFVEGFVERTHVKVNLQVSEELGRLPRDLETALFRLAQECLTNIHRHSGSPTAEIRLVQDAEHITLEVRDRGKGLPELSPEPNSGAAVTLGIGIQGMRERVRQLGGRIEIGAAKPGTLVRAVLPLRRGGSPQGSLFSGRTGLVV